MEIVRATLRDLDEVELLFRRIEEEARPAEPGAAEEAAEGLYTSQRSFDFLASDSFWLLCAQGPAGFAGYAAVVRIPKLDARRGFLYVDELYVLESHRRAGAARALIAAACEVAVAERYRGVRLLVKKENAPARELYRRLGFVEHDPAFCERLL